MLGINYESSDEEEILPATKLPNAPTTTVPDAAPKPATVPDPAPAIVEEPLAPTGPVNGPAQGPTVSPPPADADATDGVSPGSLYTSIRALIQNLTLPTVPNFEIPPSPPGSPPQRSTKKFAQFLELKKKGQHFNQRLENSSVLRDPSHLRKLMDFAGITEEDQYASTLQADLAVPTVFPGWAYFDELNAAQKRISKAKEDEKRKIPREALEFIPASKSGALSGTDTPSSRAPRQSAAERIMTELDSETPGRTTSHGTGKRKQLEHRGRDESSTRSRWGNESRSPKRRRSRSRERR